jgi:hypothetical protein
MDMSGKGSPALTVAVFAALAYDIISATNSSPQTTEINAAARSETLMKWVKIGELQIAGFAILGCIMDKSLYPAVGAALGGGLMWYQYQHANASGLANAGPPTEDYSGNQVDSQA